VSAVLEANPFIGSTEPRLFTPPLPEHADPNAEYGIKPDCTWGPLCVDFLERILGWHLLPWQKWLYYRALEKRRNGTSFRFRYIIVLVARQNGKLVDLLTDMLTPDGFKNMGDLRDGDWVYHPDGHPVRIVKAHDPEHGKPSYRVSTTDGRSVVAGGEHLWYVCDRRNVTRKGHRGEKPVRTDHWEVLSTNEIMARGLMRDTRTDKKDYAFRLPVQQRITSKPTALPIDPYTLGVWLGDGSAANSQLTLNGDDMGEIIDAMAAGGTTVSGIRRQQHGTVTDNCYRLSIRLAGDTSFPAAARTLGVLNNKHVPEQYLTAGTEQRAALLAGLLDTDGHISRAGQVEFCNTNRQVADAVLYLCRSLGYRATLVTHRASMNGDDYGDTYRICFTPNETPFRLHRHTARITPAGRDRTVVSISDITEVPTRPMRCITVDSPDGLYLAGRDLIPTHNTKWGMGLGLWRLFMDKHGRPSPTWPAAKLAVVAAQNLDYAENTLKEIVDEIRDHPLLAPELLNHRVTNGRHRAILSYRRNWRAATANKKGGRSLSVDFAWLDELRTHTTPDAWNAVTPTTNVRICAQVLATSNAGEHSSVKLRDLRTAALRKITIGDTDSTQTGFFEWSVPDDVDPRDDQYWYMANPALGLLNEFCLDDLRAHFENMEADDMPGFRTEYLALDVNTPVLTTAGWKTVGTVEAGDRVFHPGGHPVEVLRATDVFDDRPCFEVTTTDGRSVVADADHRWLVNDRRSNRGWETLSTEELLEKGVTRNRSGGRYAYRLPDQQRIISKPVELPLDPYVLGAWLGDGTASKPEITSAAGDVDAMRAALGIPTSITPNGPAAWYIRLNLASPWSRDGFTYRAKEVGVWRNKHVPERYLTAGTEQRLALLQGLLDTDGSIGDANRVRFCNTNKQLAESVLYLARSLGQRATLRPSHSGAAYMVCFTASQIQPFRLPRKAALIHASPSRAGERTAISIRTIIPVPSRPTRCITVDSPDSLFLAGRDLLPTQQCQWVDSLTPGIIPAQAWADTLDPTSRRDEDAPLYACIDVSYHRTRSYVAVAGVRDDGKTHMEVLPTPKGAKGTDWVVPWIAKRKERFAGICVQKSGAPASSLIDDLRAAGVDIIEWGAPVTTLAAAAASFYDGLGNGTIAHRPAVILDRAAASTPARTIGDAWFFDRRKSPVDAAPLVACCGAVWLLNNPPPAPGPATVWEWPDDDTLDEWRKEADDRLQ
jgi:hypothetical protein